MFSSVHQRVLFLADKSFLFHKIQIEILNASQKHKDAFAILLIKTKGTNVEKWQQQKKFLSYDIIIMTNSDPKR